jgi:hypothetical protein
VQLFAAVGLQALFWHVPPLAQTRPHCPQFTFELASATHVLLHSALVVSLQRQVDPPHVASPGHVLVPAQTRLLLHTSLVVQLLPSLHALVLLTCLQSPAAQLSVVQGSRSSQSVVPVHAVHMPVDALHTPVPQLSVPRQTPPLQVSGIVQPIWSLHDAPSALSRLQPVCTSQVSAVHGLPSSGQAALFAPPALQVPISQ